MQKIILWVSQELMISRVGQAKLEQTFFTQNETFQSLVLPKENYGDENYSLFSMMKIEKFTLP